MKKRPRRLRVDGQDYVWIVREDTWPELTLRVWKAGETDKTWLETHHRHPHTVTPEGVADLIRAQLMAGKLRGV